MPRTKKAATSATAAKKSAKKSKQPKDYTLTENDKKGILTAFKKAADKIPAEEKKPGTEELAAAELLVGAKAATKAMRESLNLFIYKRKNPTE